MKETNNTLEELERQILKSPKTTKEAFERCKAMIAYYESEAFCRMVHDIAHLEYTQNKYRLVEKGTEEQLEEEINYRTRMDSSVFRLARSYGMSPLTLFKNRLQAIARNIVEDMVKGKPLQKTIFETFM